MHIIVRSSSNSRSEHFRPHYNSALGKRYHTKDDYLGDMKRMGMEPARSSNVRKVEDPTYKPSKWARDMGEQIKAQRGKAPSGRFLDELAKKGHSVESLKRRKEKYDSMRKEDNNA